MALLKSDVVISLTEINCGECGGVYAINARYHGHKRENGGFWTCPYCKTGWGFGESLNDKLQKELAAEKARHSRTLARVNEVTERATKAEKKLRRVAHGVCPCCKRSFTNLARHMKTKHPEEAGKP